MFLCPGGPSAGDVAEGETVRFTTTYSGSHGEFREVSAGDETAGWAEATDADAASGVTTAEIFGLPAVTDPAFDGPDCTSTAPTTSTTTTTETTETTIVTTTAETTATTVAPPTTTPRTTAPRVTTAPTNATTATTATTLPTTATTEPTTTTTTDTDGPLIGPVRLRPSTITERGVVGAAAVCGNSPTVAQLTVTVSDPSGVASVVYEAQVKGRTESGTLSNSDDLYSGTVGPFNVLFAPNDNATSAVIAVVVTATDTAGNISTASGTGTLLRCTPTATTSTTSTTVFTIF